VYRHFVFVNMGMPLSSTTGGSLGLGES